MEGRTSGTEKAIKAVFAGDAAIYKGNGKRHLCCAPTLEKVSLKRSFCSRSRFQAGVEAKARDFVVFESPRPLTPTVTFLSCSSPLFAGVPNCQFPPGLPLVSEIAP